MGEIILNQDGIDCICECASLEKSNIEISCRNCNSHFNVEYNDDGDNNDGESRYKNGYCIIKKARNHLMKRIDPVLGKPYAFGDDQAWYIYEGLVAFKNSKRYGTPYDTSEDNWEKYLDDMIFPFYEITHCYESSDKYDAEEYEKKYNRGKELFGKYFLDLWD